MQAKAQISNRSDLDVGDYGLPWSTVGGSRTQPEPVDPKVWFPADRQDRPLELEIGSGKGTFL
ncbi:MAG: hypothetical protein R3336_07900, partial [Phycisphaeraceae bacterium]|nr:hypothetical protein [Phycisphaeraceae bacterium]